MDPGGIEHAGCEYTGAWDANSSVCIPFLLILWLVAMVVAIRCRYLHSLAFLPVKPLVKMLLTQFLACDIVIELMRNLDT